MDHTNLTFAWVWICVGLIAGAGVGLGFHRVDWMGGYGSWPRRLTRLGHIAFLGTAGLNLAFAWTVRLFNVTGSTVPWSGRLLIVGAVAMPIVCYVTAWRPAWRSLFVIPVVSLLGGAGLFAFTLVVGGPGGGGP